MMLQQQQGEQPPHPSASPSFSSYSSETLADIAARVITELRLSQNDIDDDPLFQPWEEEEEEDQNDNDRFTTRNDNENNENDDEFEFAFPNASSPVSADDIFCNGQIRPTYTYPIFNAPYLNDAVPSVSRVPNSSLNDDEEEAATVRRRLPLRKLMFEERETSSCSSSDHSVEEKLEGVAEGTYCVWNPNAAVVARDRKKSNSTGSGPSSKRWKLRELLLRSLSDGKGKKINSCNNNSDDEDKRRAFVFGVPSKRTSRVAAAKPGPGDDGGGASAERVGKKSVLPYKQELVGLFANVNGLGRNLHPF